MATAALVLSIVALLLSLLALARAGGGRARVEELESDLQRRVRNVGDEAEQGVSNLRTLVARMAGGEKVTPDMVVEGRVWREVEAAEAQRLITAGNVRIVDVRTRQETQSGVIPGAQLIPIEELERRAAELPRDGVTTLLYCAGGARSAAACEYLTLEGHTALVNLAGGIGSWTGPTEQPSKTP